MSVFVVLVRLANSGMSLSPPSPPLPPSLSSLPPSLLPSLPTSSINVRKAAVLMGLDWEKIRKIVSCGRKEGRERRREG